MKLQTFVGKVNIEGLHHMDDHINAWLQRTGVTPIHIKQSFGNERGKGANEEPVVVITIWYEGDDKIEEEF